MTRPGTPPTSAPPRAAALPRRVVELAASFLPAGTVRDRYRAEFLADLWGMNRSRQVNHALRVLLCVWALRMAVTSQGPVAAGEADMITTVIKRPLLCRLNLHHTWVRRFAEDGHRYRQCALCGKDDSRSKGSNDGTSGMAAGFGTISGT
jgi:hypothetical protein